MSPALSLLLLCSLLLCRRCYSETKIWPLILYSLALDCLLACSLAFVRARSMCCSAAEAQALVKRGGHKLLMLLDSEGMSCLYVACLEAHLHVVQVCLVWVYVWAGLKERGHTVTRLETLRAYVFNGDLYPPNLFSVTACRRGLW